MKGRPTKYNEGILELANEYMENYEEHGDVFPSILGLACVLRVTRKTLYNWAENNEAFLHILEELKQKSERTLLKKGLINEFNSNITKLALGKYGYHDKSDVNTTMDVFIESKDAETL